MGSPRDDAASAHGIDAEAQKIVPSAPALKTKSSGNLHARTTTTADKTDGANPSVDHSSNDAAYPGKALSHHFVGGINNWLDRLTLILSLLAWYSVGVLAIVTTKVLIADWHCPALVLSVQQLFFGSIILRLVVAARDGAAQPWPWEHYPVPSSPVLLTDKVKRHLPWLNHMNFVLAGVFHSLDFLCSNLAFSQSAAHFVETIKASDPITTTAIALISGVDTLGAAEGASLFLLVAGVLLSTWGNSKSNTAYEDEPTQAEMWESLRTVAIVTTANVCFAFRAMNQKRYRVKTNELQQLDDVNLFCRMCQTGATFLALPLVLIHWIDFRVAWNQSAELQWTYLGLALVNSFSYVTYK